MLAPLKNQNPVRGGDCGEIAGRLWGDCQEIGGEIEGRLREIAGRLWGAIERGDCVEIAGDCGEIDVVFSSGNSGDGDTPKPNIKKRGLGSVHSTFRFRLHRRTQKQKTKNGPPFFCFVSAGGSTRKLKIGFLRCLLIHEWHSSRAGAATDGGQSVRLRLWLCLPPHRHTWRRCASQSPHPARTSALHHDDTPWSP